MGILMNILACIERLQEKPSGARRRIAFFVSLGLTLAIVGSLSPFLGVSRQSQVAGSADALPDASLFADLKRDVAELGQKVRAVAGTASTTLVQMAASSTVVSSASSPEPIPGPTTTAAVIIHDDATTSVHQ